MQYKVVERNHDKATGHVANKVVLYQGTSAQDAVKVYNGPHTLPFGEKSFYAGRKLLYAYQLYDLPK
jgi:hypothetical protein